MDRLDAMTIFVAAVDEGSLAAAARRVGRSPASATRAVAMLEAMTGETLLRRSTRRLGLTDAGERRAAVWREILARLAESEEDGRPSHSLWGSLAITAPELFGQLKVIPVIELFMDIHPQISVRVLLLNRLVNLVGEGIDLAVRLAPLPDSGLTAVKVGEVRRLVCASPGYLDRAGVPQVPDDLAHHDCIALNTENNRELWTFALPRAGGARKRSINVPCRLSVNSSNAAVDIAVRGRGLVQRLSYQVADSLAAGKLIPVLGAFEPASIPVYIVFHPHPPRGGAIRAFVDHAVPKLKSELLRITTLTSQKMASG